MKSIYMYYLIVIICCFNNSESGAQYFTFLQKAVSLFGCVQCVQANRQA